MAEINLLAKYPRAKRNLVARKLGQAENRIVAGSSAGNISTAPASRAMAATAMTGAGFRSRATSPRISGSSAATACSTSAAPRAS